MSTDPLSQDWGAFGYSGTLRLGYDVQIAPKLFVGAFGEVSQSNEAADYLYSTGGVTAVGRQAISWGAGGRLGFTPNAYQAWFLTAGLTEARYSLDISSQPPASPGSTPKDLVGRYLGVGTETLLGDRTSLTLEFRHTQFDNSVLFAAGAKTWAEQPDETLMRIGLNYRFGAPEALPAMPAPSVKWQGVYVGGGGGYDTFTTYLARGAPYDDQTIGRSGVTGYLQAGYDLNVTKDWLVGAFVDDTFGRITAREPFRGVVTETPGWAAGARVGRILDRALIYATAGYALNKFTVYSANYGPLSALQSQSTGGWFVGGGTETMLTNVVSLKLEYRYEDLDRRDFSFAKLPSIGTKDAVEQSARMGLAYKF